MKKEVGQFSIEDGTLSGPGDYMREQGNAKLDAILEGRDVAFNTCARNGAFNTTDLETAVLVAMQNDYAGWKGMSEFLAANLPAERTTEGERC